MMFPRKNKRKFTFSLPTPVLRGHSRKKNHYRRKGASLVPNMM